MVYIFLRYIHTLHRLHAYTHTYKDALSGYVYEIKLFKKNEWIIFYSYSFLSLSLTFLFLCSRNIYIYIHQKIHLLRYASMDRVAKGCEAIKRKKKKGEEEIEKEEKG